MQIGTVCPSYAILGVTEKSIAFDGWMQPESFRLVSLCQGQKKQNKLWPNVFDSVRPNTKAEIPNLKAETQGGQWLIKQNRHLKEKQTYT